MGEHDAWMRYHISGESKIFYNKKEVDALDPNEWSRDPSHWVNQSKKDEDEPKSEDKQAGTEPEKDAGESVSTDKKAKTKVCAYKPCGAEFEPKSFNQKYCNPECRDLDRQEKTKKSGGKEESEK